MENKQHQNPIGKSRSLLGILAFVFGVWFLSKLSPKTRCDSIVDSQGMPEKRGQHSNLPAESLPTRSFFNSENPVNSNGHKIRLSEIAGVLVATALFAVTWFQGCQTKKAAEAAQQTAILATKQMESLKAAVIEMPHEMIIQFPTPPFGEARANFINSGGVNAHQFRFNVSIILQKTDRESELRTIVSASEKRPVVGLTGATSDYIFPFDLTPAEYEDVMKTQNYIVAKGSFEYENGFGTVIPQPFCYAYIWGSQKFGRSVVKCSQAQQSIRLARSLAH